MLECSPFSPAVRAGRSEGSEARWTLFAQGVAEIHVRPNRELQTLASLDVTRARSELGADVGRFTAASMISEIVLRFPYDEEAAHIFDAVEECFDRIGAAEPAQTLDAALGGAWRIIAHLGFTPALDVCANCHAPIDPSATASFSHTAGGALCVRCGSFSAGSRVLPSAARDAIRAWTEGGDASPLSAAEARAHQRLLREFFQEHLGSDRELRGIPCLGTGGLERRVILGTAGHIDHGKTALVMALTGVNTDRLPEEKRRGITIDLGFAPLVIEGIGTLGVVDVPGHEAFVRTMLAGASGIDIALLVVAADEGVMPQTREHLEILSLLAIPKLVVAMTKRDLVSEEWLALAIDDVRSLLAGTSFAESDIVAVSAVTGDGLPELRKAIRSAALAGRQSGSADDLFRMPVDRAFTIKGTGTVVTGTVWSGSTRREAMVTVFPPGNKSRIRAVSSITAML